MTTKNENEINVNGVTYIKKGSAVKMAAKKNKPIVLIRSYAAGVHFGYLEKEEFTASGKVVVLSDTRRIHYWDGAASLSQLALEGVKAPENCRITVSLPSNEIVNVIETIPMTDEAAKNLTEIEPWKK